MAASLTWRRLARLVARTGPGQAPGEPGPEVSSEKAEESELRLLLSPEVMAMLQRAARDLSEQAGRRLPMAEVLECLLADHLAGSAWPGQPHY